MDTEHQNLTEEQFKDEIRYSNERITLFLDMRGTDIKFIKIAERYKKLIKDLIEYYPEYRI